jgi:hypothetical protein
VATCILALALDSARIQRLNKKQPGKFGYIGKSNIQTAETTLPSYKLRYNSISRVRVCKENKRLEQRTLQHGAFKSFFSAMGRRGINFCVSTAGLIRAQLLPVTTASRISAQRSNSVRNCVGVSKLIPSSLHTMPILINYVGIAPRPDRQLGTVTGTIMLEYLYTSVPFVSSQNNPIDRK